MPHRSPDSHRSKITCLDDPDDLLTLLHESAGPIKTGAGKILQNIQASSQKRALHGDLPVRSLQSVLTRYKTPEDLRLGQHVFCQRIGLLYLRIPIGTLKFVVPVYGERSALQKRKRISLRILPRLSESTCTRAVNPRHAAECRHRKDHIRVVRISHVPFGLSLFQLLKIDTRDGLVHQLTATDGDERMDTVIQIEIHQVSRRIRRLCTDPKSVRLEAAVRTFHTVAPLLNLFDRCMKSGDIRFRSRSERRGYKPDSVSRLDKLRYSHFFSPVRLHLLSKAAGNPLCYLPLTDISLCKLSDKLTCDSLLFPLYFRQSIVASSN